MSEFTQQQKQQIEDKLAERHDALCAEIRSELARSGHEHFADLAGEVTDAGDASVADFLMDKNVALISRQVDELAAVERAQKHLPDTDFGDCAECGEAIGLPRLLAQPEAIRCIHCQETHEKMFAHAGTPKF